MVQLTVVLLVHRSHENMALWCVLLMLRMNFKPDDVLPRIRGSYTVKDCYKFFGPFDLLTSVCGDPER